MSIVQAVGGTGEPGAPGPVPSVAGPRLAPGPTPQPGTPPTPASLPDTPPAPGPTSSPAPPTSPAGTPPAPAPGPDAGSLDGAGPLDDAGLLAAHAAGDEAAFGELVRRHRDRLWAVALRTLGDREEAADALQDALLSAYRAAGRFRGDSAVTTWLHRIVVNACLDRVRRRKARPTVPLPESGPGEPAAPEGYAAAETALAVRAALDQLPAEQRAALVLLEIQGYSVAEVAAILGVPEGTVKSRCARARARLAVTLGYLRNPGADDDVGSTDAGRGGAGHGGGPGAGRGGAGRGGPGQVRGQHGRDGS